jgi:hypothetical protein
VREVLLGCRRALCTTGGGRARDVRQEELKTMMGVNERVQEQRGEVRTNTVRSAADCALVLAVLRSMMPKIVEFGKGAGESGSARQAGAARADATDLLCKMRMLY